MDGPENLPDYCPAYGLPSYLHLSITKRLALHAEFIRDEEVRAGLRNMYERLRRVNEDAVSEQSPDAKA